MLKSTFLHIPGIGTDTERRLWERGIRTWEELEAAYEDQLSLFPEARTDRRTEAIQASREALAAGDAAFFAERLPSREHYRIAATFPEDTVFLDIETTGLSLYYDNITLIGVSRGKNFTCLISGTNDRSWLDCLSDAKCIVTFNGTMFDLKFIQRQFPDVELPPAHVDLRFLARRAFLSGGQKEIESRLGIVRPEEIKDIRGVDAALMWYHYKAGNVEAGRRLALYNHSDIEGMKAILDQVVAWIVSTEAPALSHANGQRFATSRSTIQFSSSRGSRTAGYVYIPRYRGRKGPLVNYADLIKRKPACSLRVVGIDLTGSERRPTGWCLLDGRRAKTALYRTDKELIAATKSAKPDIVSIDSPLSLPVGRRSVRDTDRGRTKYGIMRECERVLKQRGVNVYPCLIPSMQGLTERGIRLARKLRSLGIPVIESYPGAAQDIMNIPRKRASLGQLKDGLRLFGIRGEFLNKPVTHDEVDAVTAAVVGLFFWNGKFEALGNDAEERLIIPDLHKDVNDWKGRRIIGISGPISAGKTTAARHLEAKGYAYDRYSLVLADVLLQEGCEPDRAALQEIGARINRKPGQRWLNQQLLARFPHGHDLVIDGLRWPEDHAFWVERFGPSFAHLHVDAAVDTRRERSIASGRTAEEFDHAMEHPVEQAVPKLRELAHVAIANERSEIGFKRKIVAATNIHFAERVGSCQSQ